eukprot:4981509-Pleurochrysis_carterae.AAC.2
MSDSEAKALLSPLGAVPVLRLSNARALLCQIDAADETDALNTLAAKLLRVPGWCAKCFQPCEKELAKWLEPDVLKKGVGYSGSTFCMPTPEVPRYVTGKCVRNDD